MSSESAASLVPAPAASAIEPEIEHNDRTRRVIVTSIVDETVDARSFTIESERCSDSQFAYTEGQFITVRVPYADGLARCYSLSSSPEADGGRSLTFTVKRVVGGVASNWICDRIEVGDRLDVLAPTGVFTPASLDDSVVLVAGGSGITPIMSIAKSILHAGTGHVLLVYANRNESSVIFAAELRALGEQFGERITVVHILESVQGYPVAHQLRSLIAPIVDRHVYVCGPEPLMDLVESVSLDAGIPRARLHAERFVSLSGDPFACVPLTGDKGDGGAGVDASAVATVAVDLYGEHVSLQWQKPLRLLDALLNAGVEVPFSCREGACSACVCTLRSGEVRMASNEVLTDDDIADGYILPCQAEQLTEQISIEY